MTDAIDDIPETLTKFFVPEETQFAPGEPADVSYITTDVVDFDREVIVSSGIDTKTFFFGDPDRKGNPVVYAKHDMQQWPVGTCEWIKISKASGRRTFNGLIAKTIYDEDVDAMRVFGMVKRGVARCKSVTVKPPADLKPGEWGPPTKEEIRARPDWAKARRIIRRSVLFEYSVVPRGANPDALVLAVSKGLELPSYLQDVAMTEMPDCMGESEESASKGLDKIPGAPSTPEQIKAAEAGHGVRVGSCGHVVGRCRCGHGGQFSVKVDRLCDDCSSKAITESSGTSGGYATEPEEKGIAASTATTQPATDIKAGDYVEWGRGRAAGCGKCMSIHKAGKVPGVAEDVEGTEDAPAARVKCYARGDGDRWRATEKCMGHRCADLSKIAHDMDADEGPAPKSITLDVIPDLPECRTKDEVESELVAKAVMRVKEKRWGAVG